MKANLPFENLQSALAQYTVKKPDDINEKEQRILEGLGRLLKNQPYDCEQKGWIDTARKFIDEYFRVQLMKHYARISYELLKLETTLKIKNYTTEDRSGYTTQYKELTLSCPVFASVSYDKGGKWEFKTAAEGTKHDGKEESLDIILTADAPPLTREVKQHAMKAKGVCWNVYGTFLQQLITCDLINSELGSNVEHTYHPNNMERIIIWRPKPDKFKIEIEEKDPALLLKFKNNDLYLVTTWDVPNEQPFKHYLAEFGLSDEQ